MNIRNWGLGDIMQLPDCCFGRRWPVGCFAGAIDVGPWWDISEIALPEKFVLWEVMFWQSYPDFYATSFRLALGDQLPVAIPMMDRLEPLLPGVGRQGADPRYMEPGVYATYRIGPMRTFFSSSGRRLVLEVTGTAAKNTRFQVVAVISSIPSEVPDWLISGNLRSP